ncbi:hypothetical protein F0245_25425 [Vibrio chagasii]|uniref:Uncharacterized protein n=1 Tax=Vibrio chagasii TaxID=170679 RepID=A0A7Y3YTU3_9VIBR|nr:hypothetical protein [Vibrio chagasii]
MAQQNSNLTLSNSNSVTSVSPLEHESSPKNDISERVHSVGLNSRAVVMGWVTDNHQYIEV